MPRRRQNQTAMSAAEKLYVQIALQRIDLLNHRWRRDKKFFCGFIEATYFSNYNKCFKLRIVHNARNLS